MELGVAKIAGAVAQAQARMATLEQELNEADSRLGDGDTGSMLARVVDRMAAADLTQTDDVGVAFGLLARATLSATGSSLGTLLATGLMAISKATKGQNEVPWSMLGSLLSQARDAMSARGGAQLGDKTVLDALDAVAVALAKQSSEDISVQAATAAWDALERFRDQPCRIGRARMFPEQSIGANDPGMLALAQLTSAITAPKRVNVS